MDAAQRHVLDAVPVGLQIWEATGDDPRSLTLRYVNAAAARAAGFDLTPFVGCTVAEVFPATRFEVDAFHAAAVAQEPASLEVYYEGDERLPESWWRARVSPLGGRRILAALWNVTRSKRHERELRESERLNAAILAGLQEGVVVIDTQRRIVAANDAAARLFGMELGELKGRPLSGIPADLLDERGRLLGPDRLPLSRALRREEVREAVVRVVRNDGTLLWVEVHANPLVDDDGRLYGAVASYDDVSVRVERDRRTREEADTDPLTGLANRRVFERTLEAALERAGARGRSVDLLMLDLDGFKAVNDSHGHAAGDDVLREVARRLRSCVRERDLVARLGGDEFVVVLTDVAAAHDTHERVRTALCEPIAVNGGTEVTLRAALGVATFPEDGRTPADLLACADRGMYAAKAARGAPLR